MEKIKVVNREIIVRYENGFVRTKLSDGRTFVDPFKWELGFKDDIDLDYREDDLSLMKIYEKNGSLNEEEMTDEEEAELFLGKEDENEIKIAIFSSDDYHNMMEELKYAPKEGYYPL